MFGNNNNNNNNGVLFGGGAKPAGIGGGAGLFGGIGGAKPAGIGGGAGLFGGGGGAKPAGIGGGAGLFGGGGGAKTAGIAGGGGLNFNAKPAANNTGGMFGAKPSGAGFGGNTNISLTPNQQQPGRHLNSIKDEPRPQLENYTVEDIVTEWDKRISDHEQNFTRTVTEMKSFDDILFRIHKRVKDCSDTVFELHTHCKELDHGLGSMEKFQDTIDGDLTLLEQEVKRVLQHQSSSTTADKARESNYKLAEQVDLEVMNMMIQIQNMTKKLNEMEKVSDGQGEDFSQIIKIVDRQQRSLEWLNAKANELENAMQHADAMVTSQQRKLFVERANMR